MNGKILNLDGKESGTIELPSQFNEEVREDIIKRDLLTIQSHDRQKYGAKPTAGQRSSAKLSRRRRQYRGAYGIGISRVSRKIMSRRGTRMVWVGAFSPGTVGGRKAHPPKATKDWSLKINKKEKRKAIRSALSATVLKQYVGLEAVPLIVDNKLELLNKTKDVKNFFKLIGLEKELERAEKKKVRAGRGKHRGRKYRKKKGPLIVVSKSCPLTKSAANIPGVDISQVKTINTRLLAPGGVPGRITIYTQDAIETLRKENLFN